MYVLSSNIDVFNFAVKPLIFNYMALIIIGAILALKEAVCVCVCMRVVYALIILPNSKSDHINNETHQ